MKQLSKEFRVAIFVAIGVIALLLGIFYGAQAYRHHLDQTSYATRAWDYLYVQPRDYVIGYVAQSEQTGTGNSLCVDVYAAPVRLEIPEKGGVVIYVASDAFSYTTDCPQIIYAGTDGYEPSDFGWNSYLSKYRGRQDLYHMTELPFHFQLNLTPEKRMGAGAEGIIHVAVIPFTAQEDPGQLDGAALNAWIEKKLSEGDPDGIEIPYYCDGNDIYWSPKVIAGIKEQ